MLRIFMSLFFLILLFHQSVFADTNKSIAEHYFPAPQKVGEAMLTYLFWDVYHAELYASPEGWNPDKPFALSINYLRDIKGIDIADKSISEIKDQGFNNKQLLAIWQEQLREIIPDVYKGTRLTGVRDNDRNTVFYHNGKKIGEIRNPQFTLLFFNIWLGEKTSEPSLRKSLLGNS